MQTLFLNGNVQIRFTCYLSVLGNGSETTTVEIFQKRIYIKLLLEDISTLTTYQEQARI